MTTASPCLQPQDRVGSARIPSLLLAAVALLAPSPAAAQASFTPASKVGSTQCPSGAFFDLIDGGTCWKCPGGMRRTVFPVNGGDACEKPASEIRKPATNHGRGRGMLKTDCGRGQFWDPNGNCYSCPSGTRRTAAPVTAGNACVGTSPAKRARAQKVSSVKCQGGSFFDPIDGGSCWRCPAGTTRTVHSVKSNRACEKGAPIADMKNAAKVLERNMREVNQAAKDHLLMLKRKGIDDGKLARLVKQEGGITTRVLRYLEMDKLGAKIQQIQANASGNNDRGAKPQDIKAISIAVFKADGAVLFGGNCTEAGYFWLGKSLSSTEYRMYGWSIGASANVNFSSPAALTTHVGFWTSPDADKFAAQGHGLTTGASFVGGIAFSWWWVNNSGDQYSRGDKAGRFLGWSVGLDEGFGIQLEYGRNHFEIGKSCL